MIFYTYESKIKDYFKKYPSCIFEYEEFSLILKLLTLDKVSDEYIIKIRENSKIDDFKMILNGVDYYLDEIKPSKNLKLNKENEDKNKKSSINYEKILNLMKNNKNLINKIKEKELIKRDLKSKNYRILESVESEISISDSYIPYNIIKNVIYIYKYRLYINSENENEILSYLLLNPQIESIYPKLKVRHNTIIQSNNISKLCNLKGIYILFIYFQIANANFNHFSYTESFSTGVKYLEDKYQLTGKNIVIGIGDSGLDINHCFFSDSATSVSFNSILSKHRKIQAYDTTWGDRRDEKYNKVNNIFVYRGGHGTHVCGIAAGSFESKSNDANISFKLIF